MNTRPDQALPPVPVSIGGEIVDVPRITNFYRWKRCAEAVKTLLADYNAARDPDTQAIDYERIDPDRAGALNLVILSAALFEIRPELTVPELEKRMTRAEVVALIAPAWELIAHNFASGAEAA